MNFIPVIVLALAAFLIAAFAVRLPRTGWTLFGATLLFGLAGYALQGAPGYPGAPKQTGAAANETNFAMIEMRREFFGRDAVPSRFVTVADGFARNGKFEDAANMLGNAVSENPADAEAWLALGNALVDHADGQLTPAAIHAYARAEGAAPDNPATAYFLGLGLLGNGRLAEARGLWADLVANAPDDAVWREQMELRLERLDALLAQGAGQVNRPVAGP